MFSSQNIFLKALKAVIISLIFTVLGVLVFALVITLFSLPSGVVKPVNYLIKTLAVFLGCYFSIVGERGALKGFLFGVLIMLFCHLVFSVFSCDFSFSISFLWDVILGGAVGGITGIVAVNKKANL